MVIATQIRRSAVAVAALAAARQFASSEQVQHRISNLNFYCADRETGGRRRRVVGQVQASAAAAQAAADWAAVAAINLLMKTGNKLGQLGQLKGRRQNVQKKIQRQARKNAQKN